MRVRVRRARVREAGRGDRHYSERQGGRHMAGFGLGMLGFGIRVVRILLRDSLGLRSAAFLSLHESHGQARVRVRVIICMRDTVI